MWIMIRQALDETFDLRQAIEFDEEFMNEGRQLSVCNR
jgi:hypothetical protein